MTADRPPPDGLHDSVDRLLEGWARAAPDLDLSPVAVIARLGRLRRIIESELEATFAEHGLNGSDFSALVTLRRLDRPGGVSQRELMRELDLSSGTVSVRVESLHRRGLVARTPDAADHRNSLVTLTEAGRRLFEQVTPAHVATENRLLAALSAGQRDQLVTLLRQLLVSFEGSTAEAAFPRLGLTLAPAHATLEIRRAVGLPEVVGLLVRAVERGGRAFEGGLRIGDVLVRAGGREVRSVATLHAAARDGRRAGRLRLVAVRGMDTTVETVLDLRPGPLDEHPRERAIVAAPALHTV